VVKRGKLAGGTPFFTSLVPRSCLGKQDHNKHRQIIKLRKFQTSEALIEFVTFILSAADELLTFVTSKV